MTTDTDTTEDEGPMVQRNLRVPRGLWDAAAAKGKAEDPPRGISVVVRDLLDGYVAS